MSEHLKDNKSIMEGVKAAPAIGYSVVANLGGDRQFTAQCFVDSDETDDNINRAIDKVFRAVDRQKAKYDLEKQEAEFEEAARHLRNFLNAVPIAETELKHRIAVLKVELQAMQEAEKAVFDEGYNAHVSANRKGAFEPRGALLSRLNGMDADIKKKMAEIEAAPKDGAQSREQTMNTIARYQEDIIKRRAYINELRRMAGREPHTAFEGIEFEKPGG